MEKGIEIMKRSCRMAKVFSQSWQVVSEHNFITFCIHIACGLSDYKSVKMEFTAFTNNIAVVEIHLK